MHITKSCTRQFTSCPNCHARKLAFLSERQTLLAISSKSYLVFSTQREVKGTHFGLHQRIVLREYNLETNKLIMEWLLHSNELAIDPGTLEKSIITGAENTSSLTSVLGSKFGVLADHPSKPKKPLKIDKDGLYILKGGNKSYLMSVQELSMRIPDITESFAYEDTPIVRFLQTSAADSGVRYFVVIETTDSHSGMPSELVISLPETRK